MSRDHVHGGVRAAAGLGATRAKREVTHLAFHAARQNAAATGTEQERADFCEDRVARPLQPTHRPRGGMTATCVSVRRVTCSVWVNEARPGQRSTAARRAPRSCVFTSSNTEPISQCSSKSVLSSAARACAGSKHEGDGGSLAEDGAAAIPRQGWCPPHQYRRHRWARVRCLPATNRFSCECRTPDDVLPPVIIGRRARAGASLCVTRRTPERLSASTRDAAAVTVGRRLVRASAGFDDAARSATDKLLHAATTAGFRRVPPCGVTATGAVVRAHHSIVHRLERIHPGLGTYCKCAAWQKTPNLPGTISTARHLLERAASPSKHEQMCRVNTPIKCS